MKSLNDADIICKKCNEKTEKTIINKTGFNLRAWKCNSCNDEIVHPVDLEEYNKFKTMREKTYSVKLRLVGNSYAVSIPREIIDFQESLLHEIDEMIKISFDSPERLSLCFSKKFQEDLLNSKRRILKR
tara:strand:+ start:246 stop:632 length:387 start_codon:yes stop_codon:yes gene_type:complete